MDCSNTYPKAKWAKIAETSEGSKDKESRSGLNRFLELRNIELPEDVTADILRRLGVREILKNAQRVCSSWRNISKDPSLWRVIDMKDVGDNGYLDVLYPPAVMCRRAVDRSQGQLIELHIDHFATDRLLAYVSERSSKLRCLQIRGCNGVRDDGLIEAAKKFPLLEELHLVAVINVRDSIEPIGQSCPKLKSFTLSSSDYKRKRLGFEYDECDYNFEALAIAKSMPGLRHLRLVGNAMTNTGLQAILDGCPNLESLDIRGCFNVDLRGGFGDRIAKKIKDFKCLNDPIEGCDWDADIFYYEDFGDDYPDYDSPEIGYSFGDPIDNFDY